jgi:transcriptional regulator with XRE-family HTH domain
MSVSRHHRAVDVRRVGAGFRALRLRRQLTQHELAVRTGLHRSKISRIERGRVDRIPFGDLVVLGDALGARIELDLSWRGATLDRLVDARHAATVGATIAWLTGAGWTCMTEVSFSIFGERGSIDVVAIHPSGAMLAVEVKASIGDANQTLIAIDRTTRLLPTIARERGWPPGPIGTLLVVADGTTSRRRIAEHAAVFLSALPTPSSECRRWVRAPRGAPPRGIVFLGVPNVHSKSSARAEWPPA